MPNAVGVRGDFSGGAALTVAVVCGNSVTPCLGTDPLNNHTSLLAFFCRESIDKPSCFAAIMIESTMARTTRKRTGAVNQRTLLDHAKRQAEALVSTT